jgi:hypothetical protein
MAVDTDRKVAAFFFGRAMASNLADDFHRTI